MKIFYILFLLLFPGFLSAQGEFNQWYFGYGAVLNFNGGTPVASEGSPFNGQEGAASIADAQGNLLFYADGTKVWNSNHQVMPNGAGLNGSTSTSQAALIVPVPGEPGQYYLFTLTDLMGNGDLSYSIIDMALDGGLGDILPGSKNILLGTDYTEKLVAASTDCGVWVLTHKRESASFHAYPVTASGIGTPVISVTGTPHGNTSGAIQGVMKVSPDNQRIALATIDAIVEVFDFSQVTGLVSNPIPLPPPSGVITYGLCFSPNSQLLYVGEGDVNMVLPNALYQYDLSSGTTTGIMPTKTLVGNPVSPFLLAFDLQLGPDNKIYVERCGTNALDVVASPDSPGAACNYISGGVLFQGDVCSVGLPNQPRFPFLFVPQQPHLGNDTTICQGQTLTLTGPATGPWLWSDGSTGSSLTVTTSGTYSLQTGSTPGCIATDQITVTVEAIPDAQFSASTLSGCIPLQVNFQSAGTPGTLFSWNFGDGSTGSGAFPTHVYNSSGCQDVSLVATSPAGCSASSTLPGYICSYTAPSASFTCDPLFLEGPDTVAFFNSSENATSWTWSFGDQSWSTEQSPTHSYQPSGEGYLVLLIAANANGCQDTASTFIPFTGGPVYYVPNAFTPDGNEFNQVFLPVFTSGFDPARYSFQVFNRWGELLFESLDYRTGWDGSSTTGTLVPDGVYTWKIYYSPPDTDERVEVTGHVVLTR